MGAHVECRELCVAVDETPILPQTSFTLQAPGLVALTGPNGAGKTTLLKTLAGRQLPSAGECLINSLPPYEFDPTFRAAVASLIDPAPMARDMTLLEQLALVQVSWGTPEDEAFCAAEKLLVRLTIAELGERFPRELSSGQVQLFAVALTLSRPCRVLLLDEPERHLDDERADALLELLEEHVEAGALVITATHRASVIARADRRIELAPSVAAQ